MIDKHISASRGFSRHEPWRYITRSRVYETANGHGATKLSQLSSAALAAIEARMSVVEMEEWEEDVFPDEADRPDVYLDLRNHIIHEWSKNVQRRLSVQQVGH